MQSLVFFNKEGDSLNFRYDDIEELWEGDIIFHANSDDTYKTIGLYVFEKIQSFDYERPGDMQLQKFQLFNEYRFNISGNSYFTQSISKIQLVNVDSTFYSKWVYGENFESKFPIGTQIRFDQPFLEFTNYNKSYTVVKTKKNAIMIMTDLDNRSFNEQYGAVIDQDSTYFFNINSITYSYSISGVNSIGIYDYIKPDYSENLSSWSEPNFYDKYFNGRILNLINTNINDGIYNIKNVELNDKVYTRYTLDVGYLTQSFNLMVDVTLKTELPTVYSGGLGLTNSRVYFSGKIPKILKPGVEFFIPSSILNTNGIVISNIRDFKGINMFTYFEIGSQVIYENNIYQCILAHNMWAGTSFILPTDTTYWSNPNYLPVVGQLTYENFNFTEIQLTKNRFTYSQSFTQSIDVTFGSSVENYSSDLKLFNIDYYYENKKLYADLIYPSNYADVKFLIGTVSLIDSTKKINIYEKNVETEQILKPEINENICENFTYNIVFTDIDEFGIRLTINGQIYYQDIEFIYDGLNVNMERTIDKTLRNWLTKWYIQLSITGVIPKLKFTGKSYSIYLNTIQLTTEYPNVPLNFLVEVGTTANFYLQRSQIIFNKLGSYLSITINDRTYGQKVVLTNGVVDIVSTLQNWTDDYSIILEGYGIYVEAILSMIIFNVKEQDTRFEISVNVGASSLPGEKNYFINDFFIGNFGALITSNAVVLTYATYSFEDEKFATGQLVTINNSSKVWNNQEYNIEYLDPRILNLSYQGPFWPTIDPLCDISPFITIALSNGFGATGCTLTEPISPSGEFNFDFNDSFSILLGSSNSYVLNTNFEIRDTKNLVDLIYLNFFNKIYVMGDRLTIIDSVTSKVVDEIILPGINYGISITFNEYNNYIYCLTDNKIYVVDPLYPRLDYIIQLSQTPLSCSVNPDNGDVYVSFGDSQVKIWYYNNFTNVPSMLYPTTPDIKNYYNFAYNKSEMDMYITSDNSVVRINGVNRTLQDTYIINGVKPDIFYQPQNSSLYVFDTNQLININGGVITPFSQISTTFSNLNLEFNNIDENMVLSTPVGISTFDLDGNLIDNGITPEYGPLVLNQLDGDIYLASQNNKSLFVYDTKRFFLKHSEYFPEGNIKKIIYNPDRQSIFGIVPNNIIENQLIFEYKVSIDSKLVKETTTYSIVGENNYGTLDLNYVPHKDLWLKTREYIRKPRENYNDEPFVNFVWKWVDDQTPEIFLYDFSGEQLNTGTSFSYIGPKPLPLVTLNRNPNKKLDRIGLSEFQQTIFDEIKYTLEHVDEQDDFTNKPVPMEIFIGCNSEDEGVISSVLNLYKRENISFTVNANSTNNDVIKFSFDYSEDDGFYGMIIFDTNSNTNFRQDNDGVSRGLKSGQFLKISVFDNVNKKNTYISKNNGIVVKIKKVFTKYLMVEFTDTIITNEFTQIDNYPSIGNITYLSVKFEVIDKLIGKFNIYSQTEIEDIRYKTELSNTGHLIDPYDTFIFKTYDINEQGIDWTFLNRKRKEMLMVRDQIFPYVGSYKSIINSINFFGYNDLELYEYYRNIDTNSKDFYKLFKVEIPDIFDNSVEGWKDNDFIKHTLPNPKFEDTNLFNLTYKITDKLGNNVLLYSLSEVILKLQGLKIWLEKKVIPITHRILDITGRADFVGVNVVQHKNYDTKILNIKQDFTPIDFSLNEAYLMPINSGSTVYTCHVDFFMGPVPTYSVTPDYFTVRVRTYKTYKEWTPFTTYQIGDRVIYYGVIYESVISNNKIKNPKKYNGVLDWSANIDYQLGQYAKYNRDVYQYIGTQSSYKIFGTSSTLNPYEDIYKNTATASWFYMTEWRNIDLVPVQNLMEYRNVATYSLDEINLNSPHVFLPVPIKTGHSFNFTIDSNIDPFISIEVTSYNGYGQIYTSKKNYEIRGLNDISDPIRYIDPIGPFQPIVQIKNPLY